MPTGAELFVRTLAQLGITQIFTLVGDHLNEVLVETARAGVRIIDMRHESAVVHATDSLARATRKPAVSLVTGGPGHTNSLTGIATAYLNCSPVIAVSGSLSTQSADRGAFQDIDQVNMARPVVKWAAQPPSAAQIPFYLGRAYNEASSGRKGPVHLTIPVDLFATQTDQCSNAPAPLAPQGLRPDPQAVERTIDALRDARHPVVIAGSGIWWADAAAELREFIELTSLPVYTITQAKGAISDEHPLCMGYADPALNKAVHKAFKEADLFLVLGKRIDYRLALGGPRLFSPTARFIQVDIHPQELGMNRKLEIGICADLKSTLQMMIAEAGLHSWKPAAWLEQLRTWKAEWDAQLAEQVSSTMSPLHPAAFFAELKKWTPKDLIYSWDGGDVVHWGRATHPMTEPGRWLRLGPLGTIGAGLPNGLALQIANPGKPVAVITGDGSLGFYIAEMDSAVRHRLPVVIIVGNDGGWGIERELQGGGETVACELRRTRYDLVMQGFGGGGETIDTLDQVRPAVERAFSAGIPYCLNVNVKGVRSPFTQWQIAGKKK
ncbi:MAG TPA: thiamine pyrophosphate-binding protein [Bryobacteraceae bacterium]|jgi:acetolactate synthase-1/2/3 large subunit